MLTRKIIIATDAVADIEKEWAAANNVYVLPSAVSYEHLNGMLEELSVQYIDDFASDEQWFFNGLAKGAIARTHANGEEVFYEFFMDIVDKEKTSHSYLQIFFIAQGSGFSVLATEAAKKAAARINENHTLRTQVCFYDSCLTCFPQWLVVERATRIFQNDPKISVPRLTLTLDDYRKKKLHILGVLGDLKYLLRGGRTSRTKAWAGTLLGIKPVGTYNGAPGKNIDIIGKTVYKGGGTKCVQYLMEQMWKTSLDGPEAVYIADTGSQAAAVRRRLEEELKKGAPDKKIPRLEWKKIGPVTGAHVGPDTLLVCWED